MNFTGNIWFNFSDIYVRGDYIMYWYLVSKRGPFLSNICMWMENPEWLTDKTKTDVKQQVNRKYSVTYKLCENSRSLIWLDYL